MASNERSGDLFKFIIYLIVIILINMACFTLFFRIDLTSNRIYSLSDVSKEVVSTLSEPLTINVFFTKNLRLKCFIDRDINVEISFGESKVASNVCA